MKLSRRQLIELISESLSPTFQPSFSEVYCDMDGVLVDFVGGPINLWDTEIPVRRFHISIANLTGNPGDSVR